MAASPIQIEFSNYCPQLDCGERLDAGEDVRFCGSCGRSFNACRACGATNRLLAECCRGCGRSLDSEVWPSQGGLTSRPDQDRTIHSLCAVEKPFPLRLGAEVLAPPVAADGLVVVATREGQIVLLRETDGGRLGQIEAPDTIAIAPALRSGVLFVAARRTLFAFDLADSLAQRDSLLWRVDCDGTAISQPLVADGKGVYVVSQDGQEGLLDAFAQSDGRRLWPSPVRIDSNFITAPVLAGGGLVFGSLSGQLTLVSSGSGNAQASREAGRNIDPLASAYLAGDRVVMADVNGGVFEVLVSGGDIRTNDLYGHSARISSLAANGQLIAIGHLAGLTLLDSRGNLKWTHENSDAISVAPIVAGESVFALDDAGNALLFSERRSNPSARVKLLNGEINTPPLLTRSKVVACNAIGQVSMIDWK